MRKEILPIALATALSSAAAGQGSTATHTKGRDTTKYAPSHAYGYIGAGATVLNSKFNYVFPGTYHMGFHWHNPTNSQSQVAGYTGLDARVGLPFTGRATNLKGDRIDTSNMTYSTIGGVDVYAGIGRTSGNNKVRVYHSFAEFFMEMSARNFHNPAPNVYPDLFEMNDKGKIKFNPGIRESVSVVLNNRFAFNAKAGVIFNVPYEDRATRTQHKETQLRLDVTISILVNKLKIKYPKPAPNYNDGNSMFIAPK
jgi:hypothetical protein